MTTPDTLFSPIRIVDTTLRDGEQAAGVSFTAREKMDIAAALAAMGISEIEVGVPASGEDEMNAIEAVVDLNLPARIIGWCRADIRDLDCAHACGLRAVHISLPVSPIHIRTLGKTEQWVRERIDTIVPRAKAMFEFVSVGFQDASRDRKSVV